MSLIDSIAAVANTIIETTQMYSRPFLRTLKEVLLRWWRGGRHVVGARCCWCLIRSVHLTITKIICFVCLHDIQSIWRATSTSSSLRERERDVPLIFDLSWSMDAHEADVVYVMSERHMRMERSLICVSFSVVILSTSLQQQKNFKKWVKIIW